MPNIVFIKKAVLKIEPIENGVVEETRNYCLLVYFEK